MISLNEFNKERELRQIIVISFVTACAYILVSFLDRNVISSPMKDSLIVFHLFVMPSILFFITLLAYTKKYYTFMIVLYMFAPLAAGVFHLYIINVSSETYLYKPFGYLQYLD